MSDTPWKDKFEAWHKNETENKGLTGMHISPRIDTDAILIVDTEGYYRELMMACAGPNTPYVEVCANTKCGWNGDVDSSIEGEVEMVTCSCGYHETYEKYISDREQVRKSGVHVAGTYC